jgi:hypothetical protein
MKTLSGSNQFVLFVGAVAAIHCGFFLIKSTLMEEVAKLDKSTVGTILILLWIWAVLEKEPG